MGYRAACHITSWKEDAATGTVPCGITDCEDHSTVRLWGISSNMAWHIVIGSLFFIHFVHDLIMTDVLVVTSHVCRVYRCKLAWLYIEILIEMWVDGDKAVQAIEWCFNTIARVSRANGPLQPHNMIHNRCSQWSKLPGVKTYRGLWVEGKKEVWQCTSNPRVMVYLLCTESMAADSHAMTPEWKYSPIKFLNRKSVVTSSTVVPHLVYRPRVLMLHCKKERVGGKRWGKSTCMWVNLKGCYLFLCKICSLISIWLYS